MRAGSLPVCILLALLLGVRPAVVIRNIILFPPSSLHFVSKSAVDVTCPNALALHGSSRANFKMPSNVF